jgi:hypothetical protein
MPDRRTGPVPARVRVRCAGAFVLFALAGVAGCSGSGGNSTSSGSAAATSGASGAFSASQLKNALLTSINGTGPITAPDAGSYASLPAIHVAEAQMLGMTITPRQCQPATVLQGADLDTGALGGAPAAVVNFRVGSDGVSEVLAASGNSAAAAVGKPIPASCTHYSAAGGGKTFQYAVRQDWIQGIGTRSARVLNISCVKQGSNVWSILYRGSGFVGAITVVGPNASEDAVRQLGQQAYSYAEHDLGG